MWEVESGEITIEVPTTSPIISRQLRGGAYIAGVTGTSGTNLYSDSQMIVTSSTSPAPFLGPYLFDPDAPFVLSGVTGTLLELISAGDIARIVDISQLPNAVEFPASGEVMFDYGQATQEGPVKYLYKASDFVLVLDPSYIFQYNHIVGSRVTLLHPAGLFELSGTAAEYPPYITDPTQAQATLEQLVNDVTSVGIIINWLIRYPQQFYGMTDIYATIAQEEGGETSSIVVSSSTPLYSNSI